MAWSVDFAASAKLICEIVDDRLVVLVLHVAHRNEIYR
jgi:mRNA-degrading endonuclease RelE of RelBE toxin-antitoxin system